MNPLMARGIIFGIVITLLFSTLNAQTNIIYKYIDSLVKTNSMLDAMTAVRLLKTDYAKDSLDAEYWLKYSQASYVYYRYEAAKMAINKAIKLSPKGDIYYFEKGLLHNRINELDTAEIALCKAIDLRKSGEYYYWRGIVYQQLKKNDQAERDYQQAIQAKFETPELYNNCSILLAEKGEELKALSMTNLAIRLDANNGRAYSTRSKLYLNFLKVDSCCYDRNKAKSLGYENTMNIPDTVCNGNLKQKLQFAADALAVSDSYKAAIKAYSALINLGGARQEHFQNRGFCYYKLKQYTEAEKDYIEALKLPGDAKDAILNNLSLLYFDVEDYKKALEMDNKRIELNPNNHVAYLDRGLINRKLKKTKEAEQDFNKSLLLKPDFFRAYGYRSFLYFQLGEYNKAYNDALQSVQLNSKYGYGYFVLAQAKYQLGLPDFCIDLYKAREYGDTDADQAIKEYCK